MNTFLKSNNRKTKTELLVKESLLSQLSNTVKEVQLLNSQRDEVFSTNEATNTLVVVLEAIFLHGIKRSAFRSVLSTMGGVEESKPQPSFWVTISKYTHKDTILSIKKLSLITTDVGRSRVWIRQALNCTELTSYLQAIDKDRKPVNSQYYNYSFIRDRDTFDMALQLLEGLVAIRFEIPTNSSLLNTWSNEPLMLAGIWSPSLRAAPIYQGVDVAEGLYEDENVSMTTASSLTSLSAILQLDENQALKVILDTLITEPPNLPPKKLDETVTAEENPTTSTVDDEPQRHTLKEIYQKEIPIEEETEEPSVQAEDEIIKGNAIVQRTGWSSDIVTKPKRDNDEKTYTNLLESYGSPQKRFEYDQLLTRTNIQEEDEEEETSDPDYELVSSKNQNWGQEFYQLITKIPKETSLKAQNYTCSKCGLSIGLNFTKAKLCYFTGKYYCSDCHVDQVSLIPSRLIYNWDHKQYQVSAEAFEFLQEIQNSIIDIKETNPKLYYAVEEMKELNIIRLRLNLVRAYLHTCKEPILVELQKKLWPREYLYEQIHTYSINDLRKVPNCVLANELLPVIKFGSEHILSCWLCSQKGFICELCKNPKVIYPFDCDLTYRCNKCYAVYHGVCLQKNKSCPKCRRKRERLISEGNEENTTFEISSSELSSES